MNQEEIIQASILERQYQELEQNLQLVNSQILELEQFQQDLNFLISSDSKKILSSLGKGVFIESSIENKDKLFVEVGSGVIVRKTPEEAKKIVENQISRLKQAHIQIQYQIEFYQNQLQDLLGKLESGK